MKEERLKKERKKEKSSTFLLAKFQDYLNILNKQHS